jgi:hypothetical protein
LRASIVLIILIVGWMRVTIFNTRRSPDRDYNVLKLEIKRVVSITRKQMVNMAGTIYVKELSYSSKLWNYVRVYICRRLSSEDRKTEGKNCYRRTN